MKKLIAILLMLTALIASFAAFSPVSAATVNLDKALAVYAAGHHFNKLVIPRSCFGYKMQFFIYNKPAYADGRTIYDTQVISCEYESNDDIIYVYLDKIYTQEDREYYQNYLLTHYEPSTMDYVLYDLNDDGNLNLSDYAVMRYYQINEFTTINRLETLKGLPKAQSHTTEYLRTKYIYNLRKQVYAEEFFYKLCLEKNSKCDGYPMVYELIREENGTFVYQTLQPGIYYGMTINDIEICNQMISGSEKTIIVYFTKQYTVEDYNRMRLIITGKSSATAAEKSVYDLNRDGKITVKDYEQMLPLIRETYSLNS